MKLKSNRRAGLLRKPYHIALGCLPDLVAGKKVTKGRRGPKIPTGTPMAKAFLNREEVERLLAQQQQP